MLVDANISLIGSFAVEVIIKIGLIVGVATCQSANEDTVILTNSVVGVVIFKFCVMLIKSELHLF